MSQAKRYKKPTNYIGIETSCYLVYLTREPLFTSNSRHKIKPIGTSKMAAPPSFSPQRELYANEAQKQTLLQAKCVTSYKNKLNNKRESLK